MTYSISCVLIIPVALRVIANTLIQGYGFGPNNMSVQLVKTSDASSWYGCQVWCDQAFIDFIQARQASDFQSKMIISTNTGPANTNWRAALQAAGMDLAPEA